MTSEGEEPNGEVPDSGSEVSDVGDTPNEGASDGGTPGSDAPSGGAGASGGISGSRAQTLSNRLWESLSAHVYVFLHNTTLGDVATNGLLPCPAVPAILSVEDDESETTQV